MFKRQNYVSEATMFRRLLLAYYISSRLRKTAYLQVNGNDDHKVGIIFGMWIDCTENIWKKLSLNMSQGREGIASEEDQKRWV